MLSALRHEGLPPARQRRKHQALRRLRTCMTIDAFSASTAVMRVASVDSALALSDPATIIAAPASNSRNPFIAWFPLFTGAGH